MHHVFVMSSVCDLLKNDHKNCVWSILAQTWTSISSGSGYRINSSQGFGTLKRLFLQEGKNQQGTNFLNGHDWFGSGVRDFDPILRTHQLKKQTTHRTESNDGPYDFMDHVAPVSPEEPGCLAQFHQRRESLMPEIRSRQVIRSDTLKKESGGTHKGLSIY